MSNITDSWSTPQYIFDAIATKHGPFVLDAAASEGNAKCAKFFTEADDSLNQSWHAPKFLVPVGSDIRAADFSNGIRIIKYQPPIVELPTKVWLNCPYSNVTPWLQKAKAEAAKGCQVVMLLNYDHTTKWWKTFIEDPNNNFCTYPGVTYEKWPERITFDPPPGALGKDGLPVKVTTNTRPSVVVIFHPNGQQK